MRKDYLFKIFALSLFLTAGCAETFENDVLRNTLRRRMEGPQGEVGVRIFNSPYQNVFKAVERTIIGKKYPILVCNEKGGIIDSDYRVHDGDFTLGFVGAKLRSKMVARLAELNPEQVEVTLMILAEKEEEKGKWFDFPVSAFNLDLIDSDSYDMYFYYISENIKSNKLSGI